MCEMPLKVSFWVFSSFDNFFFLTINKALISHDVKQDCKISFYPSPLFSSSPSSPLSLFFLFGIFLLSIISFSFILFSCQNREFEISGDLILDVFLIALPPPPFSFYFFVHTIKIFIFFVSVMKHLAPRKVRAQSFDFYVLRHIFHVALFERKRHYCTDFQICNFDFDVRDRNC
jgi:hypothetical protein